MPTDAARRTNRERSEATRALLLAAARKLFVAKGYADTGTPEIVAAAGVTRGALYHHFNDKQALFRAVVEQESAVVAAEIERATANLTSVREALLKGGEAFLRAMSRTGRTRLLLLDGPAVLGRAEMNAIDDAHGARTLREGISDAMGQGVMRSLPVDALTAVLAAAFDRAALEIESGGRKKDYRLVIEGLVGGLFSDGR